MSTTANNIANVNTPDFESSAPVVREVPPANGARVEALANTGPVDLVMEIPNLILSGHFFAANVVSAKTAMSVYEDILKLGERG